MACTHDHSCEDHDCSSNWSLYKHIDLAKVTALNEANPGSVKSVFKAWEERLNSSGLDKGFEPWQERLESNEGDPELLVYIPSCITSVNVKYACRREVKVHMMVLRASGVLCRKAAAESWRTLNMYLGCDSEVSYPLKGPHMGPDGVDEGPGHWAFTMLVESPSSVCLWRPVLAFFGQESLAGLWFTSDVKIKSISVVGGADGTSPSKLRVFINREGIDFSDAQSMQPVQEWELVENLQGVLEYQTRYSKFQSVANITLHFPESFGGDTTQIHYIGFKGEATQLKRDVVATIVYEITPNPSDHKYVCLDVINLTPSISDIGPGLKLVDFLMWNKESVVALVVIVKNLTTPFEHAMAKIIQMLLMIVN
ncbi:PITH domain-containing protein 1-like [Gossypium australe]|uniref:PITH domain-containing protein 1-like n=1 Tax=Gossypium australe TaxID=47621 RepID=A0A5B6W8H6_9ROSI|nr:PITH domain-containing protein 1-like [Gossypium australe]